MSSYFIVEIFKMTGTFSKEKIIYDMSPINYLKLVKPKTTYFYIQTRKSIGQTNVLLSVIKSWDMRNWLNKNDKQLDLFGQT